MGTIIMIGVIVLTLGGAFWSYNHSQQAIGEAKAIAQYERQQKEAEEANTLRALEGEQYALQLLEAAKRRNQAQAVQLAAVQKRREEQTSVQERKDPELKAWGDTLVPVYAANSLRQHALAVTAAVSRISVPGQPSMAPGAPVADAAGPADESWISRVRRKLTGSTPSGVERSGQDSK